MTEPVPPSAVSPRAGPQPPHGCTLQHLCYKEAAPTTKRKARSDQRPWVARRKAAQRPRRSDAPKACASIRLTCATPVQPALWQSWPLRLCVAAARQLTPPSAGRSQLRACPRTLRFFLANSRRPCPTPTAHAPSCRVRSGATPSLCLVGGRPLIPACSNVTRPATAYRFRVSPCGDVSTVGLSASGARTAEHNYSRVEGGEGPQTPHCRALARRFLVGTKKGTRGTTGRNLAEINTAHTGQPIAHA